MKYESALSTIRSHNNKNFVVTEKGEEYPVDLLVAADGSYSTVRKLIHPTINPISFRGYEVYRGHVSWNDVPSLTKNEFTAF